MSKYELGRKDARRMLIERLLELDYISDEEIEETISSGESISQALIRMSKKSKVERAFDGPAKSDDE